MRPRLVIAAQLVTFLTLHALAQPVLKGNRVVLDTPIGGAATFTWVPFRQAYPAAPLVFLLPTVEGVDPASLRIESVTRLGFEVEVFEPSAEDGPHPAMTIDYLAIEPGQHMLPDGTVIEAGSTVVSAYQGRLLGGTSWQSLAFATSFAANPALLLEVQSSNGETLTPGSPSSPWLTAAARNVTASGAEVALERSETAAVPTPAETVAYLAVDANRQSTFVDVAAVPVTVETIRTGNSIAGWDNGCAIVGFVGSYVAPRLIGSKISRNGADGGWLRRCSLNGTAATLTIDEDRNTDGERSHTTESASLLLFDRSFAADLPGTGRFEVDRATIAATSSGSLGFTSVSFPTPFAATPVILTVPTEAGTAAAAVRLRNVGPNGFEIAAVEPPGALGAHPSMTLDYLAILPGRHRLDDGTWLEAGYVDTNAVQHGTNVAGAISWQTITFTPGFAAPPALLAQIQSIANEPGLDPSAVSTPWLTVAVDNVGTAAAQVALERSEAAAGAVILAERIGYVAIAANQIGTIIDLDDNPVTYTTTRAPAAVQGYDNGCFPVAYGAAFPATPLAVAHTLTRNGNNGGWLRRCGISATTFSGHYDEDQSNDAERSHIQEDVAIVAFSAPFEWAPLLPEIVLAQSAATVGDPTGHSSPKAIPGAELDYVLVVSNQGRGPTDSNSVVVIERLPGEAAMFVANLVPGSAVEFVDGTPASGLGFDAATDISFSDDGGSTFAYVPTGPYDTAVTHVRVSPSGAFAGSTTNPPNFTLRWRVRLD